MVTRRVPPGVIGRPCRRQASFALFYFRRRRRGFVVRTRSIPSSSGQPASPKIGGGRGGGRQPDGPTVGVRETRSDKRETEDGHAWCEKKVCRWWRCYLFTREGRLHPILIFNTVSAGHLLCKNNQRRRPLCDGRQQTADGTNLKSCSALRFLGTFCWSIVGF